MIPGTDWYRIKAEQMPALFTGLPFLVVALAFRADIQAIGATLGALLAPFGIQLALGQLASALGDRLEIRLRARWGGQPAIAMLRHRDARLNPHTRARYHRYIAAACPGLNVPTEEEERRAPAAADTAYASAVDWLKRQARDKSRGTLVMAHLISYGHACNLLALRPIGIASCLLAASALALPIRDAVSAGGVPPTEFLLAAAGIGALLMIWLLGVRESLVRSTAEHYSRALLELCDDPVPTGKPAGATLPRQEPPRLVSNG